MTTIGPIDGNDSCTSEPERELEGGAEMDRVSELLGRPRRNEERPSEPQEVVTIADIAECGCPDWCHRDHDNE